MKILLRKIKKIQELEFEIPQQGVWVVTGLNGSGKTTLFASIYRICAHQAFQKFYKTGALGQRIDSYSDAEIEYQIDGEVVTYRYGGQRWRATPRRNADLFSRSPYATIEYIEASGERIEPYPDEIQPRRLRPADPDVRGFLQHVLDDPKWANLKCVNTRRGMRNEAYVIPDGAGTSTQYFSEKSFSLGELCALKLSKKICALPQNSLLLIDEVEMALHPQAQVRLLRKVVEIAAQKNLTVLFSTHSATLIKNVSRKNIIHLRSDQPGRIKAIVGAFPAQVLGDIAFDDELGTDYLFYVEDKQAKMLAEQMLGMYMSHCHPDGNYRPLYKVAPVGGFVQVIEMLNASAGIFPNYVRKFAFLDEDVKTETLTTARRQQNQNLLNLFNSATGLNYLPCTPEVGLIELFEVHAQNDPQLMNELNTMFAGHRINIGTLTAASDYVLLVKANVRDRAKDRLSNIVRKVSTATGIDEIHIRRTMYNAYCKHKYANNIGSLRRLLGPILNSP